MSKKTKQPRPMAVRVETRDGDILTDQQVLTRAQRELPDPGRAMATLADISERQSIRAASPAPMLRDTVLQRQADIARRAMATPVTGPQPAARYTPPVERVSATASAFMTAMSLALVGAACLLAAWLGAR